MSDDTNNTEAPSKAKRTKKEKAPEAPKKTPHLSKVEKFMSSLPTMSEDAAEIFDVARNLGSADINVLIAHLSAETRVRGVNASATTKGHAVGQTVRVASGSTKFLGLEGTVSKSQRIRCYVQFDGYEKPGYFFHSDLVATGELLTAAPAEIASETLVEIPDETVDELPEQVAATGTDN